MRRIPWLVGLLIVVAPMVAHAQPWAGILSLSRAIDWGTAGVAGGVPNPTTVCATLNPGATAAQIISAINACPANQVVFLNAGTYNNITGLSITRSNVTLRGAGADKTKLSFSGNVFPNITPGASIAVWSGEQNDGFAPRHTAAWTAGYAKGTTLVTLSSTTGLAVGGLLVLDQQDSSDDGDIFVNTGATGEGGNNTARSGRAQIQIVTVTAINGLNVTISPGLYMPNWRASQSPGAYWGNTTVRGVGIEDMTLDHSGNNGSNTVDGIDFHNAANCWLKGVRSIINRNTASQTKNVRINHGARITIRDSYIYGPIDLGSEHYGVSYEVTSDILTENNILHGITSPFVPNDPMSGGVVGYNYSTGDRYAPTVTMHSGDEQMLLWEGNQGTGFVADVIHGHHHFITAFRNLWQGPNPEGTIIVWIQAYSRFFNIIGNVLGGSGTTVYETQGMTAETKTEVFGLGSRRSGSYGNVSDDPRVKATLMRWGNYDTVTGTSRFLPAEVPSGITNFANLVPAGQALPPSFYLSARPAWWSTPWGTPPWPAIGPEVAGGDVSGSAGHAHKIPARLCYENTPIDSAYGGANVRAFNASSCYAAVGQTVPAAPTSPVVQ